jgi:hypothetical protein
MIEKGWPLEPSFFFALMNYTLFKTVAAINRASITV